MSDLWCAAESSMAANALTTASPIYALHQLDVKAYTSLHLWKLCQSSMPRIFFIYRGGCMDRDQ